MVEQIRLSQEEKSTLINDNQTMAVQIQDLHLEVDKLRDELNLFQMAKENLTDDPFNSQVLNIHRLVTRVSELEDLV